MIYEQKIAELQGQGAEEPMNTDKGNMLNAIQSEVAKIQILVKKVQKFKRYNIENIKENTINCLFIMELLKTLEEYQLLISSGEKVKEKKDCIKNMKLNEKNTLGMCTHFCFCTYFHGNH